MWNICAGVELTEEDVLGLRSLYQPKKTEAMSIRISDITEEHWQIIKLTAKLEHKVWLEAINPESEHQPKPFTWEDSPESSQSNR